MRDLVIIGAGGFGREVSRWIAGKWEGDIVVLLNHHNDLRYERPYLALVTIGDPSIRKAVVEYIQNDKRWLDSDSSWWYAYAKSAKMHGGSIGYGTIVCANSILSINTTIGRHVHINFACTIGHDCIIGDFVTISPGVHISGDVTIGDEVFIGTGALIREKLTIGKGAVIGMGAVVVKDVPAGVTVVGNPAKEMK